MGHQLYHRLPQAFVEEVLEAFNDRRMTERPARLEARRPRMSPATRGPDLHPARAIARSSESTCRAT